MVENKEYVESFGYVWEANTVTNADMIRTFQGLRGDGKWVEWIFRKEVSEFVLCNLNVISPISYTDLVSGTILLLETD